MTLRGGALAFSDNYTGLSGAEVAKRKAQGKSNVDTDVKTKTIAQIISEHTLTFFNGINLVIALLVLATGYFRNLLFVTTPLINLFIGVIQEIRAKRQVDRLQLLTASEVSVRRDGKDLSLIHI